MAASAAGGLLFLPLLSGLAGNQGWRWVSRTIAISAIAVVPLVLRWLKDKPEDIGMRAYGAPDGWTTPPPVENPIRLAYSALHDAWRSGAFWLLAGSFFVCGLSTSGLVQQHFYSSADDHGIGYGTAGRLLLLVGVFDVIGTLGSGWLSDRVDPRKLLFAYYGLRGLSLLAFEPALSRGSSNPLLIGIIVFYGLDWIATVPPTVALTSQLFGPQRGPIVFGWIFAAHQIGGALFAWGAGAMRDWTGSYTAAYLVAAVMCLVAAASALRIGRPRDRSADVATADVATAGTTPGTVLAAGGG
jgi:predicted MFS family arabinose efflux permease